MLRKFKNHLKKISFTLSAWEEVPQGRSVGAPGGLVPGETSGPTAGT